jgi:Polyketide cyclase / dehydrase and lipid transport
VPQPPDVVFEFLSDLRNHWRLEPHFLELESMAADGGSVRVRAPLGISRVARTRVVAAERPSLLRGEAEVGRATRGAVRWEIAPARAGSRVRFSAHVEQATLLDRLLLVCGGRWWLRRIVTTAVERLGTSISAA